MYDAATNVLYAHTSDFKVECVGKTCYFTFSNRRQITAGPNAGAISKEPVTHLFRIDKNRFYEVRGLLEGDEDEPGLVVWEREERGET